ncbi:hypothetical protein GQX74_004053 [Glossina fuscipes]|nr:hypothetical protein GQX74_004053 [Glossina fuscipes]
MICLRVFVGTMMIVFLVYMLQNFFRDETMLLENSPLKHYFGSKVHSTLWVHDFRKIRRENDRNKEQNYVNYVKKPVVCDDFGNIEVAQQVKGPYENSDLVDGKDAGENFSSALKEAKASRLLMFFRNTANIALLIDVIVS